MNAACLLVLRLVAGGFIARWGFPKIRDADGTFAKEFEGFGFHPGKLFARRAGSVETPAGALIVVGALGPTGPLLLLADMLVAAASVTVKKKRFNFDDHEDQLLYGSIALLLALSGPGEFSLDRVLGITFFDRPWLRYLSLGAALAGATLMFSTRTPDLSP